MKEKQVAEEYLKKMLSGAKTWREHPADLAKAAVVFSVESSTVDRQKAVVFSERPLA